MVNYTMAYPHKECSQEGELYTLTWKNVFDILLRGKKQVPESMFSKNLSLAEKQNHTSTCIHLYEYRKRSGPIPNKLMMWFYQGNGTRRGKWGEGVFLLFTLNYFINFLIIKNYVLI